MNETGTIIIGLSLIIIMFGMGLSLTVDDFRRVIKYPKAILLGLLNQLVFLPIIGYVIVSVLELRPEIAIGIMILAACPGGAVSNIIVNLAKGDVALSISLTAISSVVSILTIPFIIQFALLEFIGAGEKITLNVPQMIGQLLAVIIVPVFVGMLIRAKSSGFAIKMEKPVGVASVILLILVITGVLIKERSNFVPYFIEAGLPTIVLNISTMGLGYLTAVSLKLIKPQAISIAVESGIQNSALAMTIAIVTLQNSSLGISAAIYTLVMYVAGFAVIIYGRK
ncbi:bile acid:sodium symporter family protein [Aquimarina pacifica]|uniref:bile acid:sodium symporter family protein n=1 Tax=Aquimarina pacifica TaxID=1296415 RepID=UPI00047023CD|nr:bile acid:sodium symporter family protein [Aquimarina pacifica]